MVPSSVITSSQRATGRNAFGCCVWLFRSAGRDEQVLWRDWVAGLVAGGAQCGDLGLEVGERLEAAVDAGEAEVGDLVEVLERAEDGEADLVRRDLRLVADGLLDPLGELREGVLVDGAPLAGLADPVHD